MRDPLSFLRAAFARIAGTFGKKSADDQLNDELQAHLEMEIEEYVRRGMPYAEARRRALIASGGITQSAEAVRDQRGVPWIESMAADTKHAVLSLRRAPGFVAVVVLTLALGIGANTAIFSVVQGVLLKPLPHRDGDRLVYLRHSIDGPVGGSIGFSVPEVRDFRAGAPSLAGIAELSEWTLTLQRPEGTVRINAGLVTGNYFDVMGLSPILGRVTQPGDDGPGVPAVMVLTHDGWVKRFGADSGIVGQQVIVDKEPVTVIGVLQPAPFFPIRAEAIFNMVVSDHHLSSFMVEGRTHRMTEMVARLAPGASLEQASTEVATVSSRVQKQYAEAYDPAAHHRVTVIPFKDVLGERARLTLWLLMGAAAFVMIISAASVANLTLMRGVRREHEIMVRAALGAGVSRLRRLLLAENLVLALLGATLGVLIAIGGVRLLTSLAERYSPRAGEIKLDGVVLAFTLLLSVGLAFMLSMLTSLPREGKFASRILAGAHRLSGSLRKHRLQRGLVVVQVAVSVVLLAGAGLLTRTMQRISDVDTGLQTEELLTMQVLLLTPTELMSNPRADLAAKERYNQMRDEMAALPGVVEVGVGSPLPLRSSDVRFDVRAEDKPLAAGESFATAELRTAGPEFFKAAGIPLLKGRSFATTDGPSAPRVVIINQLLADRLFPNEDPIGKRVAWTGEILKFTPISPEWRTVVGVVARTQDGGLDATPGFAMYMPFTQMVALGGGLVIRADSNAASLASMATRIVRRIAPTAPIENVMTIAQYKDQSVSPRRLNAVLISSFGILALIIAAVGIAGVLAFSVSARTGEIGIRMSLGADRGRVQRMILREGGTLLVIGVVLGVAGAFLSGRIIRGLLFGIEPYDPATMIVVVLVMAAIGIGAAWVPALRAARIDPAIAMRS